MGVTEAPCQASGGSRQCQDRTDHPKVASRPEGPARERPHAGRTARARRSVRRGGCRQALRSRALAPHDRAVRALCPSCEGVRAAASPDRADDRSGVAAFEDGSLGGACGHRSALRVLCRDRPRSGAGETPDCNCFGTIGSAPVGRGTLARNGALIVAAAFVAVAGRTTAGRAPSRGSPINPRSPPLPASLRW